MPAAASGSRLAEMGSTSRFLLLASLAGVLLAAGCGGSDDETPSATAWADDVCSSMSSWIDSVSSATESLGAGGLSEDGLEDAVDDVRSATETLGDDLRDAGRPETEAGQEAESLLDTLADDVEESVQELEDAVEGISAPSDVLSAISVITGVLSTLSDQVAAAFDELGQLDAADELESAFEESDECSALLSSR
jgi:hypothetical protein